MGSLRWTSSNAVFITEIDDEHRVIFEAVSSLQKALTNPSDPFAAPTNRLYAVPATGFLAGALSCFFCSSCLCFVNCCCLFFSLSFLPPLSPMPAPFSAIVT
jgi:hypothetical protein